MEAVKTVLSRLWSKLWWMSVVVAGVDDIDGAGVGAGIVFAVDGAGFVDDAVGVAAVGVVEYVRIAVDGTRGRRGVSEIGRVWSTSGGCDTR